MNWLRIKYWGSKFHLLALHCLSITARIPLEIIRRARTRGGNRLSHSRWKQVLLSLALALCASVIWPRLDAQQIVGAITGTVRDSSGAAVPDATVKALNVATNLEVAARTQ